MGHPPAKFAEVYRLAERDGLHLVAHAGEESPPDYIRHGVRCLVQRTAVRDALGLTDTQLRTLAANSFHAAFLAPTIRQRYLDELVTCA